MQSNQGFKIKHKLNQKHLVDSVFEKAEIKVNSPFFLILARSNSLYQARLGLIVAKKNLRKACDRNRVKRISREFFRLHQLQMQGLDWVILTRPPVKSLVAKKLEIKKQPTGSQNCKPKKKDFLAQELRSVWQRALLKMPRVKAVAHHQSNQV